MLCSGGSFLAFAQQKQSTHPAFLLYIYGSYIGSGFMATMMACMGPLLRQAEELLGTEHFDPLLLLTLALEDDCLKHQTAFGDRILSALHPLVQDPDTRALLLQEARDYARDSLTDEMQWRLASQHMPTVQFKARKNDLLNQQNPACKNAFAPTLLQMVERCVRVCVLYHVHFSCTNTERVGMCRSGKRKHCLAPKWIDALHTEMLNLLLEESELPCSYKFSGIHRPLQARQRLFFSKLFWCVCVCA